MRYQKICAKIKYMRTRVQSEYMKQTRLMAMPIGGNKKRVHETNEIDGNAYRRQQKETAAAARKRKRERKAHAMAVCVDVFPT
jgi:hypothetical protein